MPAAHGPTPLAIAVLERVLDENHWTQDDLAAASGVHRSTVSMHFAGARAVRDEHLTGYLRAIDRRFKQILLAAWLRDVLGRDVVEDVINPIDNRVREEVLEWAPKLSDQDRQMLGWLSNEMANDPDLADMLRSICRRLGYGD